MATTSPKPFNVATFNAKKRRIDIANNRTARNSGHTMIPSTPPPTGVQHVGESSWSGLASLAISEPKDIGRPRPEGTSGIRGSSPDMPPILSMVHSPQDQLLHTKKQQTLERWAEHFQSVLNRPSLINSEAIARLPQIEINYELPTQEEVIKAISQMFSGGKPHALMRYMQQGRLPESQCGFHAGRGTVDMIFAARQLHEKCQEQHRDLNSTSVDLTKAFDSGSITVWVWVLDRVVARKYVSCVYIVVRSPLNGQGRHSLSANESGMPFHAKMLHPDLASICDEQ
ncbi:hypothetical protein Bbelb_042210 [Branchiostoma belcheri]|nr:hypothetical protein Bbelb_042210 [Branchiostoma belcheri]